MLRYLYLSSASLKFDSHLNNSIILLVSLISTLRSLGFCSVSPVSPSVCFLPSLITPYLSSNFLPLGLFLVLGH